jgi:hypothetical protein
MEVQLKIGDKVVSTTNYIYDIYDPNSYLTTYAQVDDQMEGYVEEFFSSDEIILNFYGISIIVETEDFANGNFVLLRNLTNLQLVTTKLCLIKQ